MMAKSFVAKTQLVFICSLFLSFSFVLTENSTTTSSYTTTTTTTTTISTTTTIPASNSTTSPDVKTTIKPKEDGCNCVNNGTCSSDNTTRTICTCPSGFYGDKCELKECQNDEFKSQCNQGYCMNNTLTNEISCKCKPTHTGSQCDVPVCLNYCKHGGMCNDNLGQKYEFPIDSIDIANLKCQCTSDRYMGARCEFDKCFNKIPTCRSNCTLNANCECLCDSKCDEFYCGKNGVCYSDAEDKLACKCNLGYSGTTCAVDQCRGYCFNSGVCKKDKEAIYCVCDDKFNGTRCEKSIVPSTPLKSKKSSFRAMIYALTVTIIIVSICFAIYFLIQRGYFDNINLFNKIRGLNTANMNISGSNMTRNIPFVRSNLVFNKLEDEQNIIQTDNSLSNP